MLLNRPLIIEDIERLRPKSKPVVKFDIDYLTEVYNSLLINLRQYDIGYAISAPQIGIYERIILIDKSNPFVVLGNLTSSEPLYMINPIIIKYSKVKSCLTESCLSFPKEERVIYRPAKIVVSYQDINGKTKQAKLSGIEARCVWHEIDHLDGKLIIDYE